MPREPLAPAAPRPVCGSAGSCLGVGAVGEVGDRGAIGEDLLGGRGHPQDRHHPQLQGGPLAVHVQQLIHEGILAPREAERTGCQWMARAGAPGQHSGKSQWAPRPWPGAWDPGALWAEMAYTWADLPPGDRWPSLDPRPGSCSRPGQSPPGWPPCTTPSRGRARTHIPGQEGNLGVGPTL